MFTLEGTFLKGRKLVVRFKTIDEEATTEIHFERTLRIPDDGKTYPLPSGLGPFPMRYVQDFESKPPPEWADEADEIRLPPAWSDRGGVIMPVYPSEAMWIALGEGGYPCAVKIRAGGANAVSGEAWCDELSDSAGDYIVAPPQRWLDGFYIGNDRVRQFVAARQAAAQASASDIRIVVYPMKKDRFECFMADRRALQLIGPDGAQLASSDEAGGEDLRLKLGGRMKEHIYADPHGFDAWDRTARVACAVTMIEPEQWLKLTRIPPPDAPLTREEYDRSELPWYDEYTPDVPTVGSLSGGGPPVTGAVDPGRVRQAAPPYAPPGGSRFLRALTGLRKLFPFWGG